MFRKLFLSICFILIALSFTAQVNILWQTRYSSSGSKADRAEDLVIDSQGSVYVTGIGWGASGTFDFITIKYDSTGTQKWKSEYNGLANGLDQAHAIFIDNNFVYVTGLSNGGATGFDYATVKYNINTGALVWSSRYSGPVSGGTDEAFDIAVDNLGNVFVIGTSDSNPTMLKPNSAATTIKYNSTGTELWARRYEGGGDGLDAAYGLVVEPVTGTVYVIGSVDILVSTTLTNINYLILKYTTGGVLQWASTYNGPDNNYDEARSITTDALGNVYVTGYSQTAVITNYDIATLKYNSAGTQQWVKRYNGTGNDYDKGNAIKLDAIGNVYVTGKSVGISPAAEDIITIKYTNAGIEKWVARYDNGGVNPYDEGKALAIDTKGNVYVTGYSFMNVAKNNYTTLKYDSLGVKKWVTHYNGTGNNSDQAVAIAVDSKENVFITGSSGGGSSIEDYETIKYCQLTADVGLDTSICKGLSITLNAFATNAVSYSWTPNNGTLNSTIVANPIATPTVTTTYIVTVTNASGCIDLDTVIVTVLPLPAVPAIVQIGNDTLACVGVYASYQWYKDGTPISGATNQTYNFTQNGMYAVVVADSAGCSTSSTITNINTGISGIENVALLNIYPNPASSRVVIDLELLKTSDVQWVFSSITGQQIFKEQINHVVGNYKRELNLEQEPSGIYYLQVIVNDRMVTKKIVKQ